VRARPWPGNVRELKAAVDVAAVMARGGTLLPEHLPTPLAAPAEAAAGGGAEATDADARLGEAVRAWVRARLDGTPSPDGWLHEAFLKAAEAGLIGEVLARTDGNRTAAARTLGLDRSTLRGKLPRE
ncbi:MAG: helix-turn-helix domain-containing protein, partial [Planctomycetaceae bacterium]